jgi:hypothetical protein
MALDDDDDGYYVNLAEQSDEPSGPSGDLEGFVPYDFQQSGFFESGQTSAKVGDILEFRDEFAQPMVDLEMGKQTKTHETLDGKSITQVYGEKADRIGVQGVITDAQLSAARRLNDARNDVFEVRTEEWSGSAVVNNVTITPRKDKWEGNWLYDITIDLIEVTS